MKIHQSFLGKGILIFTPLTLFILIFAFTGCQKQLPEQEPPIIITDTSGLFDLADSNSCADIVVTGIYLVDQPITGNAGIQLTVDVAHTGDWKFTTDTLNGISFSGNGNFGATGVQSLTLYAVGRPQVVGNIIFPVRLGLSTYYFSVSVLDGHLITESMPALDYFKGTIGGVHFETIVSGDNDPVNHEAGFWGFSTTNDTIGLGAGIGPAAYPNPPGTGTMSFQIGQIYHYQGSTEDDFKTFLSVGSRPFVETVCTDFVKSGVIFAWNDSNSVFWRSFYEMGDQTGSSFQIVAAEDGHNAAGKYFVRIKAKFNCKLYKYPSGEVQELTNGEIVCHLVRYE